MLYVLWVLGPGHSTWWRGGLTVDTKDVSLHLCLLRTFNYILRELPKVPTHVPVCVLGNYRDMGEHRVILPDDVRDFIDNLDRWVGGPLLGQSPGQDHAVGSEGPERGLGMRTAEPRAGSWLPGTKQACGGGGAGTSVPLCSRDRGVGADGSEALALVCPLGAGPWH